jgi:rSAM/selenodomain-associated transferase 1
MPTSVVMFAKSPVPGRVKTRLAETIGGDLAAQFHRAFIADLVGVLARFDGRRVVAWSGERDHAAFEPAREHGFAFVEQPTGGLGRRLDRVIRAEAARADSVLVIGSDSPTLQLEHLEAAAAALDTSEVVLGPSFDGGYYLIGVRSEWYLDHLSGDATHPIFRDVDWSTTDVLGQTLRRCHQISRLCDLTAFWYDVDTIDDLNFLKTHLLDHLRKTGRDVAPHTARLLLEMDRETSDSHTV